MVMDKEGQMWGNISDFWGNSQRACRKGLEDRAEVGRLNKVRIGVSLGFP